VFGIVEHMRLGAYLGVDTGLARFEGGVGELAIP